MGFQNFERTPNLKTKSKPPLWSLEASNKIGSEPIWPPKWKFIDELDLHFDPSSSSIIPGRKNIHIASYSKKMSIPYRSDSWFYIEESHFAIKRSNATYLLDVKDPILPMNVSKSYQMTNKMWYEYVITVPSFCNIWTFASPFVSNSMCLEL